MNWFFLMRGEGGGCRTTAGHQAWRGKIRINSSGVALNIQSFRKTGCCGMCPARGEVGEIHLAVSARWLFDNPPELATRATHG